MSRWLTLMLVAASICIVACEEQKTAGPAATGEKAATGDKAATGEKPAAAPESIKDEDLATPADFDDEAEKDITATNYKAEVDSLEKEISAE